MGHKPSHCAPTSALKEMVVTSVITVVSLTLLRARQGERLAFAFANALAKTGQNPSHCAPTSALKEVVVTSVTTVVGLTAKADFHLSFR